MWKNAHLKMWFTAKNLSIQQKVNMTQILDLPDNDVKAVVNKYVYKL